MEEMVIQKNSAPVREISVITEEVKELCRQAQNMAVMYVIEIGKRLVEAKSALPHGEWNNWLENEVGFTQRTAQNYMQIFNEYSEQQYSFFGVITNTKSISHLPYTKALKLLALPADERTEFVQNENVEEMSVKELNKAIRERNEARKEKEAAEARERELSEKLEAAEKARAEAIEKSEAAENLKSRISELEKKVEDEKAKAAKAKEKLNKALSDPKIPPEKLAELKAEAEATAKAETEKLMSSQLEEMKKAASEATEKANKAMEAQKKAKSALDEARKQLKTANPDVAAFKELFIGFQETVNKMTEKIEKIRVDDTETAAKLEFAMQSVMKRILEG